MEIKDAIAAFSALSQESRLLTLKELVTAGPNGKAAGAIAEADDAGEDEGAELSHGDPVASSPVSRAAVRAS